MADHKSQKTQLCAHERDNYFSAAIKTLEMLTGSRYDKKYKRFMEKYGGKAQQSSDIVDFRGLTLVKDHGTLRSVKTQSFGSLLNNVQKTDEERQLMRFVFKTVNSKLSVEKVICRNKIQKEDAHPSFCKAFLGSPLRGNETQRNLNDCTILLHVDTEANNSKLKNKTKIEEDIVSVYNCVCLKSNASLCWDTSRTVQPKDSKVFSIGALCSVCKKLNNLHITDHSENNQKDYHKNVQGKQTFSRYPVRSILRKQCFNSPEKVYKLCGKNANCTIKKKDLHSVRKYKISCCKKYFERNSTSIADHDKSTASLVLADIDKKERKNVAVDNFARGNSFCSNTSLAINPTSYNKYIKENYPDLILLDDIEFGDSVSDNFEVKMGNEDERKSTLSQSKKNCYMLQQETNESENDMRNAQIKVLTIDDVPINTIESEYTPLHRSCESSLIQASCESSMYPSSNRAIFFKSPLEKEESTYSCTPYSKESQNYISSCTKIHNIYEHSTDSVDPSLSNQLNSTSSRSDLSNSRNVQSECHTDTDFFNCEMKFKNPITRKPNGEKMSMNPIEKSSKLRGIRLRELLNIITMFSLTPEYQHGKVSPNSDKVNKYRDEKYIAQNETSHQNLRFCKPETQRVTYVPSESSISQMSLKSLRNKSLFTHNYNLRKRNQNITI